MGTGHSVRTGEVMHFGCGTMAVAQLTPRAAPPAIKPSEVTPLSGFTTAEALLRGMRLGSVASLPVGSFPLHLVIIESDAQLLQPLMEVGQQMGFTVRGGTPDEIAKLLPTLLCDVVLLDISAGATQLNLLRDLRSAYPRVPILVTTAFVSVHTAFDAMRQGANELLTKPFSLEELTATLSKAAEQRSFDVELRRVQHQMRTSPALQELATASPGMQKLLSMITRVALSQHPVMVLGESGSGKEHVARMLHSAAMAASGNITDQGGQRAEPLPFLHLACSTTASALLETELFGYVRDEGGPLRQEQVGLLTVDGGGTLFLDEIDGLSLDLQSKLVRALQERSVRPPGSAISRPVSVRLVASSSRDLSAMMERGAFRKDLYFKLNVVNLRVPPLRHRREDLPVLSAVFLERHSRERGLAFTLGPGAMRALLEYEWPGNVRELEAVIERACTISSGPMLHIADLPTQLKQMPFESEAVRIDSRQSGDRPSIPQQPVSSQSSGIESLADMERRMILETIGKLNGDKMMAARLLGIGKTTLYRKLKEYGIAEMG